MGLRYLKNAEIYNTTKNFLELKTFLKNTYDLSRILRNSSLLVGLIFVIGNLSLYISGYIDYCNNLNFSLNTKILCVNKLSQYYINIIHKSIYIWIFIFFAIAVMFPILAIIQSIVIKKITEKMFTKWDEQILKKITIESLIDNSIIIQLQNYTIIKGYYSDITKVNTKDKILSITCAFLSLIIQIIAIILPIINQRGN